MATEKKQATKAAETKEEKMKKSTVEKAAEGTTSVDDEKKKTKTSHAEYLKQCCMPCIRISALAETDVQRH